MLFYKPINGHFWNFPDVLKKFPLVRANIKIFIYEYAILVFPCFSLQGKGNKISKTSLGQRVLVREESVVWFERKTYIFIHRLRKDELAQLSCFNRRYRSIKEYPNMCPVAWTWTFDVTRNIPSLAYIHECEHIILIAVFTILVIKISTEETAGIVLENRI